MQSEQSLGDRLGQMGKLIRKWRSRNLKQKVFDLLMADDFDQALESLCSFPARRAINPLLSLLYSTYRISDIEKSLINRLESENES